MHKFLHPILVDYKWEEIHMSKKEIKIWINGMRIFTVIVSVFMLNEIFKENFKIVFFEFISLILLFTLLEILKWTLELLEELEDTKKIVYEEKMEDKLYKIKIFFMMLGLLVMLFIALIKNIWYIVLMTGLTILNAWFMLYNMDMEACLEENVE